MSQSLIAVHDLPPDGNPRGGKTLATGLQIDWQPDPLGRGAARKAPVGCLVETVIEAALDRLRFYQQTRFATPHNDTAITHLQQALAALAARTEDRERRAVAGTHRL